MKSSLFLLSLIPSLTTVPSVLAAEIGKNKEVQEIVRNYGKNAQINTIKWISPSVDGFASKDVTRVYAPGEATIDFYEEDPETIILNGHDGKSMGGLKRNRNHPADSCDILTFETKGQAKVFMDLMRSDKRVQLVLDKTAPFLTLGGSYLNVIGDCEEFTPSEIRIKTSETAQFEKFKKYYSE